jgi:hypothetical protein
MGKYLVEPRDEMTTREWLANHLESFDFDIVLSGDTFPDVTIIQPNGARIHAEIEFLASNFIAHKHNPDECELIICWRFDSELPLPAFEMSTGKTFPANASPDKNCLSFGEYIKIARGKIAEEFFTDWNLSFRDAMDELAKRVATEKMNPDNGKNGKRKARNKSQQHKES